MTNEEKKHTLSHSLIHSHTLTQREWSRRIDRPAHSLAYIHYNCREELKDGWQAFVYMLNARIKHTGQNKTNYYEKKGDKYKKRELVLNHELYEN